MIYMYICVSGAYLVPVEVRKGPRIFWNKVVDGQVTIWVLGTKPGPVHEQQMLLTAELSL